MPPLRSLMQVLATILVVVSLIVPFAARVCVGHGHGTTLVGGNAPCSEVASVNMAGMDMASLDLGGVPVGASAPDDRQHDRDQPDGLVQHCCLSCHVTVIAVHDAPLATVMVTRIVVAIPDDAAGTSIAPEALPKPPKSFA